MRVNTRLASKLKFLLASCADPAGQIIPETVSLPPANDTNATALSVMAILMAPVHIPEDVQETVKKLPVDELIPFVLESMQLHKRGALIPSAAELAGNIRALPHLVQAEMRNYFYHDRLRPFIDYPVFICFSTEESHAASHSLHANAYRSLFGPLAIEMEAVGTHLALCVEVGAGNNHAVFGVLDVFLDLRGKQSPRAGVGSAACTVDDAVQKSVRMAELRPRDAQHRASATQKRVAPAELRPRDAHPCASREDVEAVREQLLAVLKVYTWADEIDLTAPMSDLGMDSMSVASFHQELVALGMAEDDADDEGSLQAFHEHSFEDLLALLLPAGGVVHD